jgi:hypothetical protein
MVNKENTLIIGDVHAEFAPFERAVKYAKTNNLHLLSLGDLIDGGTEGDKVCSLMLELLQDGSASLVKGNHEHKLYRYLNGANVILGPPNQSTVDEWNTGKDTFRNDFHDMITTYAKSYIRIDRHNICTHAGMHPTFWETEYVAGEFNRKQTDAMMFGQADYKKQFEHKGQTYPMRIYDWTNDVPSHTRLFVGHDPAPLTNVPVFDLFQDQPLVHTNEHGGEVVFMDCGAGKGGKLFGAVVNSNTNEIEEFVNFTE